VRPKGKEYGNGVGRISWGGGFLRSGVNGIRGFLIARLIAERSACAGGHFYTKQGEKKFRGAGKSLIVEGRGTGRGPYGTLRIEAWGGPRGGTMGKTILVEKVL